MKPFIRTLACIAVLAIAPVSAKTLTIGIDMSRSNLLIASPEFARISAEFVGREIAGMALGDVVVLRTFGARGENVTSQTFRISKTNRPAEVARAVAGFIAGLPARNLAGQDSTNIIAFLEFGRFDCENGGRIVLLTDGLESSIYVGAQGLASGTPLPEPEPNLLVGCEVTVFGFGQTQPTPLTPQQIKTALTAWERWMTVAGAAFTAIIDP